LTHAAGSPGVYRRIPPSGPGFLSRAAPRGETCAGRPGYLEPAAGFGPR